jgi:hypothetical protein
MSFNKWILLFFIGLLAGCAAAPVLPERDATIAVWDIENVTSMGETPQDLGAFLSAKVV